MEDGVLLNEPWTPHNVLPEGTQEVSAEGHALTWRMAFTLSPPEAALSRNLENGPFRGA